MKIIEYNGERLATNTDAYQLLLVWQRTSKAEDKQKLDLHIKEINYNYRKLHGL